MRASTHCFETELQDALPQRADAVVDADLALDRVVAECLALVRRWQQRCVTR
jgi:hypothetical protein